MKNYFIGIDVSKEKLDATLIHYESQSDSEQQLAYTTVANNPKGFKSLVSWSKKNAGRGVKTDTMLFCCETTGGYDRALCDWLYGNGLDIWRESALQIKRSMGLRQRSRGWVRWGPAPECSPDAS